VELRGFDDVYITTLLFNSLADNTMVENLIQISMGVKAAMTINLILFLKIE
jgi:hypothetical protein